MKDLGPQSSCAYTAYDSSHLGNMNFSDLARFYKYLNAYKYMDPTRKGFINSK